MLVVFVCDQDKCVTDGGMYTVSRTGGMGMRGGRGGVGTGTCRPDYISRLTTVVSMVWLVVLEAS